MLEITVTVKGEDKKYSEKILRYEPLTLDTQDEEIQSIVDTACKNAHFNPEDIVIKISMVIK